MKTVMMLAAAGLASMGAAFAQAQVCVDISSRQGWQEVHFEGGRQARLVSIEGGWTVDSNAYSRVGAVGHLGDAAARLEPFSGYKYRPQFNFGALLARSSANTVRIVRAEPGMSLWAEGTQFRINDSDATLGDNSGVLTLCFAEAKNEARSTSSSEPGVQSGSAGSSPAITNGQSSASCQAELDDLALLNDELAEWEGELRRTQRALDQRLAEIEETARYLSTGVGSDPSGLGAQARQTSLDLHNERVRAYNRDADSYEADSGHYREALNGYTFRLRQAQSCP